MVGFSAGMLFSVLEQADEVVYVSREYCERCILECSRYLVDYAACLLAVYNGEWRGGTAMTVRHAQKLGREAIIIKSSLRDFPKSRKASLFSGTGYGMIILSVSAKPK